MFNLFFINKQKRAAFTLIEVLLSLAIIALIAGISIPVYQTLQIKNNIENTKNILVESIYKTRSLAQASSYQDDWGLYFNESEIIIFKGSNYQTRDNNFDQIIKIPKNINISQTNDLVFSKYSGLPKNTSQITINSATNEATILFINELGVIEYPLEVIDQDEVIFEVDIYTDWETAYCANVVVSTESEEEIVWEVNIPFDSYPNNGSPYNVWEAIWEFNEQILTASGQNWNNTVSLNNPVIFGYCANRDLSDTGTNEIIFEVDIYTDWETAYCANVVVSTESEEEIVWEVNIPFDSYPNNGSPYNVWEAIWEFNEQILTASGQNWNNTVSLNNPVIFGYCANR